MEWEGDIGRNLGRTGLKNQGGTLWKELGKNFKKNRGRKWIVKESRKELSWRQEKPSKHHVLYHEEKQLKEKF